MEYKLLLKNSPKIESFLSALISFFCKIFIVFEIIVIAVAKKYNTAKNRKALNGKYIGNIINEQASVATNINNFLFVLW